MSEFTELIFEGILCQTCGEYLDDASDESDAPGYPRNCMDCDEEYSNSELWEKNVLGGKP